MFNTKNGFFIVASNGSLDLVDTSNGKSVGCWKSEYLASVSPNPPAISFALYPDASGNPFSGHIFAAASSAILSIFSWHKDSIYSKIICQEKLNLIAITPSGEYMAAAAGNNIFIWHISSGELIKRLEAHYRPIIGLEFSVDGCILVSASEDSSVKIWNFEEIISDNANSQSSHIMITQQMQPITALLVTATRFSNCRIITASMDSSVHIYNIKGQLLLKILFPSTVTTLAFDALQTRLFGGCIDGNIHMFRINDIQGSLGVSTVDTTKSMFKGHKAKVTSLAFSFDQSQLISVSEDKMIYVWDIFCQQIIRSISWKAPICGIRSVLRPANAFTGNVSMLNLQSIGQFKRVVNANVLEGDVAVNIGEISVYPINRTPGLDASENQENEDRIVKLEEELSAYRSKQEELYEQVIRHLLEKIE